MRAKEAAGRAGRTTQGWAGGERGLIGAMSEPLQTVVGLVLLNLTTRKTNANIVD
jgi:hypothetical protein